MVGFEENALPMDCIIVLRCTAMYFGAPCILEGVLQAAPRHGTPGVSNIYIHPEGFT